MAIRSSKWVWVAGVWALLAAGCADLPDWSLFAPLQADAPAVTPGNYSFSWRLSGNRRAGPIQVFDDGRSTWLQFMPDQTVPAVFARTAQGDQLLAYRRQGPYVVLEGVWPLLMLRAGGLESRVERLEPLVSAKTPTETVLTEPFAHEPALAGAVEVNVPDSASTPVPAIVPEPSLTEAVPLLVNNPWPLSYTVSPQDGNIRLVLSRWATSSGWTFESEHWTVDVDIPIAGTAAFELEFDQAVQQLLASTELSDRPLQPCFYANKVLRIVPYAQSCDRTMPRERA